MQLNLIHLSEKHNLILQSMSVDEICCLYNHKRTWFFRQVHPIRHIVGNPIGKKYSIRQILLLFYLLGAPDKFYYFMSEAENAGLIHWLKVQFNLGDK
jgi:hypothetical protein